MNKHEVCSKLLATLGVGLTLVAVPTMAAKPGGGGGGGGGGFVDCSTNSPDWQGFPAYGFVVNKLADKTWTYEIRVASRNGKCSRPVVGSQPGKASTASFAWNGSQFVLIWNDASRLMLARFDQPVAGSATTPIPATVAVFRTGSVVADLSPDGLQLVYSVSSDVLYPNAQIRVADLTDATGATDRIVQEYRHSDGLVWWSPWGKLYYKEFDPTNGKRLLAIDPDLGPNQTADVVLQIPAAAPLAVNTLFDFSKISGGYTGLIQNVVIQGLYTTGIKAGGRSGSGCAAAYSVDAGGTNQFLLGSPTVPSTIVGFYPSVTSAGTVLVETSTAPAAGSNCTRTGYVTEKALAEGYSPSVVGQVLGEFPVALKSQ